MPRWVKFSTALALVTVPSACLPIPHRAPYVPPMNIRVVGDSGRALTDARVVVHISSKPYDVYHESFEVPLDSSARAVVRARSIWQYFYFLIHHPMYYATWCVAAPGYYSQREVVGWGRRDSVTVVRLYRAPEESPPPGVIHEFQCTADRKGMHDPLHSEPDPDR
jgi:hypothetical protein